ncbi:hypothetical protein [Micromonospora sp. NPDC006431]|uniref:hypothetical protein n=1 Tax=Micromonospora sp. NPDC006431 TaxID=3364235 RepID=UPI0036C1CC77
MSTRRTPARKATPPAKKATTTGKATPPAKKATTTRKAATAKKATPAARKRAPETEADPAAAPAQAGGAEPIGPAGAAGVTAAQADVSGPASVPSGTDDGATETDGTAAASPPAASRTVKPGRPTDVAGATEARTAGTAPAGTARAEDQSPARIGPAKKAAKKAAKTAKKAAPAKETGPARRTAGEDPTPAAAPPPETPKITAATPGPLAGDEPESGRTPEESWRAVAARLLDHPGFAPELLARAAVEALGPRAGDWVERTRDRYPDADADGLARLATRRFVRLAGTGGALAAGAGLLAPVAELAAVLWTQANLVLHLAAVYGRDPGHPDRVVELLVLTQVHPDAGTARAALAAVASAGAPVDGPWPRAAEAAWRLATPLAAQAGGWLGLRVASRLLPGAAPLAAAAGDSAAAERLAARAVSLYRPTRRR